MEKKKTIMVMKNPIRIIELNRQDYISLTDMVKGFEEGPSLIEKWLRNKNTIEFLAIWERLNNPGFNSLEIGGIMKEAGLNRFTLSVKKWIQKTNGIGLIARTGRFGSGTFAHKDIAFEFGSWLSAEFKLYLIKEFQRLKDEENSRQSLEWSLQHILSKINYRIHTDAIKESLIPPPLTRLQSSAIYASEADVLNMALFGKTAAVWRKENPGKTGNIRDAATLEQLVVLANLESINAVLIREELSQAKRLEKLNLIAITQMTSLLYHPGIKKLK